MMLGTQRSSFRNSVFHIDYKPLLDEQTLDNASSWFDETIATIRPATRGSQRRGISKPIVVLIVLSLLLNTLLSVILVYRYLLEISSSSQNPNQFWTPVSTRLKYGIHVFNSGFGADKTPYQGLPGDETDKLWDDLYVEAFTITKDEARKQPNKTVTYTADPDSGYVTSFSVMHYLHCLNMIRQMTDFTYFPEHYNATRDHNQFTHGLEEWPQFRDGGSWSRNHIGHCIDAVRQALMCQPDLGPVVWQWVPETKRVQVWAETAHSCANWDVIYQFAKERQVSPQHAIPDSTIEREGEGQCGYHDLDCRF